MTFFFSENDGLWVKFSRAKYIKNDTEVVELEYTPNCSNLW